MGVLPGLESKEQEYCVEHERDGDGQDGVHEEVELHVLEAVLLQPVEHFALGNKVV
jgi:hypothetical protein